MDGLCLKTGVYGTPPRILSRVSAAAPEKASAAPPLPVPSRKTPPYRLSSVRFPVDFLRLGNSDNNNGSKKRRENDDVLLENGDDGGRTETEEAKEEEQSGHWVLKILRVGSMWRDREQQKETEMEEEEETANGVVCGDGEGGACKVDDDDDDEKEVMGFDREKFSRMLRRVPFAEAKMLAKMSYLGNLAYSIPKIKPRNLLKYHGLRFVTSSIEKRELARKSDENRPLGDNQEPETKQEGKSESKERKNLVDRISPAAAYKIVASAASFLYSHSRTVLPFGSSKTSYRESQEDADIDSGALKSEVASLMATTESVTAVVAAKEEVKQAVADDLKSMYKSPCEWFICDDDKSATRLFVIQGSESLPSWQANLLFEPVQFEGLDVLVHRGIYEAAKGIYDQMLPEVHAHLESRGKHTLFRFTGHSLGGSLSLLVNLMLLIRGQVPASSLLPVITFGSPCIMCGGDRLLKKLGLPRSHLLAITMHRDIVPRAFSCNYPNRVAEILRAVNGNFRNHPCLSKQKLLYAPMGELLILQPDENFSPHHHLLPSGAGLYFLSSPLSDIDDAEKQLRTAKTVFLNSPHPLEILSDRSAYGSDGTIKRDHDIKSYLRSLRSVVRQELKRVRQARREHWRHKFWWPLLVPNGTNAGIILESTRTGRVRIIFSGILQTGRESLMQLGRFVTSKHLHLVVAILFPARLLLLGAYSLIRIR